VNESDFIKEECRRISSGGLKTFPDDFLEIKDGKEIKVPAENLILGKEFFGTYEVTTTGGDLIGNFKNEYTAKFVVYSGKKRESKMFLPDNDISIKTAVESYEKFLDSLLKEIKNHYTKNFPDTDNVHSVSNNIFNKLNLFRL